MGAPTSDLQYFFDLQMQQNSEANNLISNSKTVIICLNCFEKKLKTSLV
jgi:hypothetical protein